VRANISRSEVFKERIAGCCGVSRRDSQRLLIEKVALATGIRISAAQNRSSTTRHFYLGG
jgi:hypothetical protein